MSKITNCFLMLKLLNSGDVYSIKRLSEELGVSERMVRYYKEQLELSGFIIESFKGPGGGYFLNKKSNIDISYFNKYDLEILERIKFIINKNGDDDLIEQYNILNDKLHSVYDLNKVLSEYKSFTFDVCENDDKLNAIKDCIENKKSLNIDYLGASGKVTRREIIPINVFEFENTIYITAFCKLRGAIRHFTLKQIINYKKI